MPSSISLPPVHPAYATKHVQLLHHPFRDYSFHIAQLASGATNGSALWLGAQVLALYFAHNPDALPKRPPTSGSPRRRACELGSGVGLTALALASMGWDVLATDTTLVIDTVLLDNVQRNVAALGNAEWGRVQVQNLDWSQPLCFPQDGLPPPFDLIFTADTVYDPELTTYLLGTLHTLALQSFPSTSSAERKRIISSAPVYLCIERRDPSLCDRAIEHAKNLGFSVKRVAHSKLVRAIEKAGMRKDDCAGVELWRLVLQRVSTLSESSVDDPVGLRP